MKNIKRTFAGIFFVIALSCSTVFAEGEMGGGGFAGTEETVKVDQSSTEDDGEMGGGGRSESESSYVDSLFVSIDAYLASIL